MRQSILFSSQNTFFFCNRSEVTDLEFRMAVEQQDVGRFELVDVSVPFEFLSDLCADGRHGHVQRVHGLDLRSLEE
jgi:hypothetical protein